MIEITLEVYSISPANAVVDNGVLQNLGKLEKRFVRRA